MTKTDPHPDSGATFRLIWSLAWPQVLMMLAHFLIGFVDVVVAGRIDREVQASMGLMTQCLFFFLIIAIALANGSVAAISQSMGAGLPRRVRRYVGLCLMLAAGFGAIFLFIGLPLQGLLLDALQTPESIREISGEFLFIYLLTLPAYSVLAVGNAVFRAQRMVRVPLYAMLLVTTLNAVGDFGLGLGWWGFPNWGYQGLAWTTFGAITAGALFILAALWRFSLLRSDAFPPIRWIKRALPYLYKVAWPAGLMQIFWQTGYLALYAVTASLPAGGVEAVAGFTAGMRIESILFLPAFALNMTASVLVGNFLGAGRADEARRTALRILFSGCAAISLCAVLVWIFIEPITALVAPDMAVRLQAADYLLFNLLAIPFTVGSFILAGTMTGAGGTIYTMIVFGACTWLLRLPLAYVLSHLILETSTGIWVAMLASQAVQALVMFYLLLYGNWTKYAMRANKTAPASRGA